MFIKILKFIKAKINYNSHSYLKNKFIQCSGLPKKLYSWKKLRLDNLGAKKIWINVEYEKHKKNLEV